MVTYKLWLSDRKGKMFKYTYNGGFYLFKVDFSVKKSLAIRAILFDSSFAENFTYKCT